MPSAKKPSPKKQRAPEPAKPIVVKPPVVPPKRFLVRCTFMGEEKKQRVNGSFRFIAEAVDATAVLPRLESAVKKLRRTAELPPRCDVYVEFILELADMPRGMVADFERWELEPRRFQRGCITFSDMSAVYHTDAAEPTFRFGKIAVEPSAAPPAP